MTACILVYLCNSCSRFFFNDTATTEIYTLSLHDALPICDGSQLQSVRTRAARGCCRGDADRKSTRLNSSHLGISYAVFCLKKKIRPSARHLRLAHARRPQKKEAPKRPRGFLQPSPRPPYRTRHFFFNDAAPPEIYPLPLHDALPISVWDVEPARRCLDAGATFLTTTGLDLK